VVSFGVFLYPCSAVTTECLHDIMLLCCSASDKEKIAKIVNSLGLRPPPAVTDARTHLQSLMSQWLPLSQAVLG